MVRTSVLAAAVVVLGGPAAAAATLINFENLAPGTTVTNQYGAQGVTFFSAYVRADSGARSGTRILHSHNPASGSDPGPLRIDFASGQRYVRVYAGTLVANTRGTLKVFDASGRLLGQDGQKGVPTGEFAVVFQVRVATAAIRRVELLYEAGVIVDVARPTRAAADPDPFEGIDDLEFGTEAAPPAPVVTIAAPPPNEQLTQRSVAVKGTVAGQELNSPAQLRHEFLVKAGSQRPSIRGASVPVSNSGSTSFNVLQHLELGPQSFRVTASNAGGLQGTAIVQVNYLPHAIRDRFEADGGATTFGNFLFGEGAHSSSCTYAVYQRGAISYSQGSIRVIRGPIFTRWLALGGDNNYPRLGCATSNQRTVAGEVAAQDFQNGRLYAGSGGTFFVNPVFAQAIDVLGGENATGTPIADPTDDSRSPYLVWQLQQFRKLDALEQPTLRSTLMIQGPYASPRLYVARQGGDNSLYGDAIPMTGAETATQMVSFPCTTVEGPCSAAAPAEETPFPDPGSYCNNETFGVDEQLEALAGQTPVPKQWPAISGDHVQTPFLGVLRTFTPASRDNPFGHEYWFGYCPWPPGGPLPPSPTIELIEAALNEALDGPFCSSDWGVNARPLPGYARLNAAGRSNQHIEWERYFSQAFLLPFQPHPGDLIFVSGRHVVDCGHAPKTEIHPPSVVAFMRTETFNGRLSTRAQVWVNGFYSGDPVEFDIVPPPRPSPTATLGYVRADYGGTPIDVTVSTVPAANRVRLRFTASPRRVPITPQGQMKWQTGRAYYSRWNVYWDTTPAPSPQPSPSPSPTPPPCVPNCPNTCRTGTTSDGCGGICPRNCSGCCNSPTQCILPPRQCE